MNSGEFFLQRMHIVPPNTIKSFFVQSLDKIFHMLTGQPKEIITEASLRTEWLSFHILIF